MAQDQSVGEIQDTGPVSELNSIVQGIIIWPTELPMGLGDRMSGAINAATASKPPHSALMGISPCQVSYKAVLFFNEREWPQSSMSLSALNWTTEMHYYDG